MKTSKSWHNFHLPDDILIQILTNLPVKNLFQLKCVSKAWYQLISHSSFVTSYVSKHSSSFRPKHTLFLQTIQSDAEPDNNSERSRLSPESLHENSESGTIFRKSAELVQVKRWGKDGLLSALITADSLQESCIFKVCGACDGGLLLCSYIAHLSAKLLVYNPITKETVFIPDSPYSIRSPLASGIISQVQESSGIVTVFMVVVLESNTVNDSGSDQINLQFQVFSSETCQWTTVGQDVDWNSVIKDNVPSHDFIEYSPGEWLFGPGIPCNGVIYWRMNNCGAILACHPFNLQDGSTCRFKFLGCPSVCIGFNRLAWCYGALSVSEGGLRYVERFTTYCGRRFHSNSRLESWVLKDYEKDQWELELLQTDNWSFDDKIVISFGNDSLGLILIYPLAINPNDKDAIYCSSPFIGHDIVCNDIVSYTMKGLEMYSLVDNLPVAAVSEDTNVVPVVYPLWPSRIPQLVHRGKKI